MNMSISEKKIKESTDKIIKATDGGKLYIETSDFFGQEHIQEMIKDLMSSSIFKTIIKNKKEEQAQKENAF